MTHLIPSVNISSDEDCHLSSAESDDEITQIPLQHSSDEYLQVSPMSDSCSSSNDLSSDEIHVTHNSDNKSDKQPLVTDTDQQPAVDYDLRFGFIVVGDNLDETVKPRYTRCDQYHTKSLHYFNSYALKDRISLDHLQTFQDTPHPHHVEASTILPSASDDTTLRNNFITLVSRVITKHMLFFKTGFSDVIEWHITHRYSDEMSKKSEVVSKHYYHYYNFNLLFY